MTTPIVPAREDLSLTVNNFWTCEVHPDRLWVGCHAEADGPVCPTSDCAGPGMPLAESLEMLGRLRAGTDDAEEEDS